jgi:hypothetical protein
MSKIKSNHRFLDEAGDTTFFRHEKICIGDIGISKSFIIGMLKLREPLEKIRNEVRSLQKEIETDTYLSEIPSIVKKKENRGFYFHATDDPPEVRGRFFKYIRAVDCSFEAVVGRKIPQIYIRNHNKSESEFYADLLSHLLKNKFESEEKLILNIAERGKSTKNANLSLALEKAKGRFYKKFPDKKVETKIIFNVQNNITEPILNIADYFCWTIQRVFERGEMRYYNFLKVKISLILDLFATDKYLGSKNYYTIRNPLTNECHIKMGSNTYLGDPEAI